MFFLLATFIMVSTSMIKNLGVEVRVPVAATGTPQDRHGYATISITDKGDIFFNKQAVRLEDLPSLLETFKAQNADPKVFINGDEHAFFGRAIAVLDTVRKLGITKVAIETRTP